MMKLLIFFLLISSSDQLSCISRKNSFNFSTAGSNTTEFENILKVLQPIDSQIMECQVELRLSYTQHLLEVIFNSNHSTGNPNSVESHRLITTFTLDPQPSIASELSYTCSTKEACDRDFVLDRFFWLLD
jgi:hypothetical protein